MFAVRSILCPVDFHEAGDAAFACARTLADKFAAQLVVMHAPEVQPFVYNEFGPPIVPDPTADIEEAKAALARYGRDDGGPIERVVCEGPTEDAIVEEAAKRHCDLIVMGTAGREGVSRFLLGSVAEHVSRRAECPVMLVKAPHAKPAQPAQSAQSATASNAGAAT